MPPNRDAVGFDTLDVPQFGHQFIKGQIALFRDPPLYPIRHTRQFAEPTPIALGLGLKRPGRPLQEDHVIHELDRNPELSCRGTVRVTFFDKVNDTLSKLNRKWFAHH